MVMKVTHRALIMGPSSVLKTQNRRVSEITDLKERRVLD